MYKAPPLWKFLLKSILSPGKLLWIRKYQGSQNKNYSRLIIIAHERSGSNYLVSNLNSHPGILLFGELFNGIGIYFQKPGFINIENGLTKLRDKNPISFLKRFIFRAYSEKVQYVGFKAFPNHIERLGGKQGRLWTWIKNQENTKVIVLYRKNLLKSYVSLAVANETDQWALTGKHDKQRNPRIELDVDEMQAYFQTRENFLDKTKQFTSGLDHLVLSYEDLTENTPAELKKVLEFLALDNFPLRSNFKKQMKKPLNEVVSNFDQIKEILIGSRWGKFVE